MSQDAKHMRRIRQAASDLLMARNYQQQAERMVRRAERELQAAIDAAAPPKAAKDAA